MGNIDTIDQKIIFFLQQDGRLTNFELSEKVGLSPSPCLRRVKNLEQRGIAGVVFEDKLFPKTNSFIEVKGGQKLANIDEFSGKIRACKENQVNPYFVVVARLEAFIAGYDVEEALKRAYAYHKAGADAILVHSKIKTSKDVDDFMARWDNMSYNNSTD